MSRILFDHIAIGARSIADAPPFIVGSLGGRSGFGGPAPGYRWWHWDFQQSGRIEVLEPDGPPGGFMHRFLERNGSGVHHVTFKVPSLSEVCARAESLGYDIVGYNDAHEGWKEAFLHPKQALGIVVQFAQGGDGDGGEHWVAEAPPQPSEAPPPVEVVGLRMVATSAERARRQWVGVLEAKTRERDDGLIFSWPGASMRIAVDIDPAGPEGPRAIELRAERALDLPAGKHPVLGARFEQLS
jgi:hypothetical protein